MQKVRANVRALRIHSRTVRVRWKGGVVTGCDDSHRYLPCRLQWKLSRTAPMLFQIPSGRDCSDIPKKAAV